MPRLIILAYRLIPARVRRWWSLGSSSSHLALADPSWSSIMQYAIRPAWRMLLHFPKPGSEGWVMGVAEGWIPRDISVGHTPERGGGSWADPRDITL